MPITCDFRSDTVTRPSAGMRAAMMSAEVGDDVLGDDPTVQRLEGVLAEMLGHEAAVFVPSGTQSNLLALMAHCARGDEYIAGQSAHIYVNEAGGGAVLGSIQPQPILNQPDGTLALADIAGAIKADDPHFAMTRLLALENTIGGKVLPFDYLVEATQLAESRGLGRHLDGARLFNAVIAGNRDVSDYAKLFDTVSICLSKGLGTPVGSVLVGRKELILRARRLRKMLGGGMRQAGILAAAGLYALQHNVSRLAEDHQNAQRLADGFVKLGGLTVKSVQTNMVFVDVDQQLAEAYSAHMAAQGIGVLTTLGSYGGYGQRWVTHLDVDADAVDKAIAAAQMFFEAR